MTVFLSAAEAKSDRKPERDIAWAKSTLKGAYRAGGSRPALPTANESYFVQTGITPQHTLVDDIFDPGASRALRNEYEARIDADQARVDAGLAEGFEEKSRFAYMKDYTRRAFDTLSRIRLKTEGDKIAKIAQNSTSVMREPIAAVVLAASFYTGRSMDFKIMNGTRVSSRVVLKDRTGSLSMPLPAGGITSTVGYNHEDSLNAQFSKQLTNNVSAAVGTAQKGSAQVVYSVSF